MTAKSTEEATSPLETDPISQYVASMVGHIENFDPSLDREDGLVCASCSCNYSLTDGSEPSPVCDACAQSIVPVFAETIQVLRLNRERLLLRLRAISDELRTAQTKLSEAEMWRGKCAKSAQCAL